MATIDDCLYIPTFSLFLTYFMINCVHIKGFKFAMLAWSLYHQINSNTYHTTRTSLPFPIIYVFQVSDGGNLVSIGQGIELGYGIVKVGIIIDLTITFVSVIFFSIK